jgi:hypothetical protein
MKKANVLVVSVVLFMVAGCSNHTDQVIPRTVVPANAGVASFSPSAPTPQTVSEAPRPEVAGSVSEITERANPGFLSAIAVALKQDKKEFCQDSQSANCDKEFIQAFHFRKVTLSKSGQTGFIVEFSSAGFCGSAGCSINVLKQTGDKIERTFENDEVGSLDSFEFATTITNGFYDLTKHGKDGTDYYYAWTGSNYEYVESPLSAWQTQTVAGASEPAQKECKNCALQKLLEFRSVGIPPRFANRRACCKQSLKASEVSN